MTEDEARVDLLRAAIPGWCVAAQAGDTGALECCVADLYAFEAAIRATEREKYEQRSAALVAAAEEAYEETRPLGQGDDGSLRTCSGCYSYLSQGHLSHCWVDALSKALDERATDYRPTDIDDLITWLDSDEEAPSD